MRCTTNSTRTAKLFCWMQERKSAFETDVKSGDWFECKAHPREFYEQLDLFDVGQSDSGCFWERGLRRRRWGLFFSQSLPDELEHDFNNKGKERSPQCLGDTMSGEFMRGRRPAGKQCQCRATKNLVNGKAIIVVENDAGTVLGMTGHKDEVSAGLIRTVRVIKLVGVLGLAAVVFCGPQARGYTRSRGFQVRDDDEPLS